MVFLYSFYSFCLGLYFFRLITFLIIILLYWESFLFNVLVNITSRYEDNNLVLLY